MNYLARLAAGLGMAGVGLAGTAVPANASPIVGTALTVISFLTRLPSASPGASRSFSLLDAYNAPAVVGSEGGQFSATASSGASFRIDRYSTSDISASASWTLVFRINYAASVFLSAAHDADVLAFSNFQGYSKSEASAVLSEAHGSVPDHAFIRLSSLSRECDTWFDKCTRSNSTSDSRNVFLGKLQAGDVVTLSGSVFSHTQGDTSAGSANGYANAALVWTLWAVPEPEALTLLGAGVSLLGLAAVGRRRVSR